MRAVRLRTEYMKDPIGIDKPHPRLDWICDEGVTQTAYRIVTDKWDSGKVVSSSMHAAYLPELSERETVSWKVRLWDEQGVPGEWSEAFFESGLLSWKAKWITGDYRVSRRKRYPVDCFRKRIICKDIVKARLYITACGVYEAAINGHRAGDFILAPGITDYRKRVQYQTYDVTGLLATGENTICVRLADGWYRGSVGAWGKRNQYGSQTRLLAQLEIEYSDGTEESVCTDESWEWSNDGPILFADNKDGEIVDACRYPSYSGRAKITGHNVVPVASNNTAVKEHERLKANMIITPCGRKVLDFGQNIAGYIEFDVSAVQGQKITLQFGEMLDADGEFTQKNIQLSSSKRTTPLQRIDYTCCEGRNTYKTTFAIFGFQYVLVESEVEIGPEDCTAIAVYTDMDVTADFDSSNELLNRFFRSTVWSAKNNSCDLPTDCPTRERHGWSGDAQIFCGTASFLFNYRNFAAKYVNDLRDGQHRNGNIPQIAPYGGVDRYMDVMNGSAGWSDAIVLIPWVLYRQYGDRQMLEECYPSMRRYAEYKRSRVGRLYPTALPTGVGIKYAGSICNYGQSYGEWAEPADVRPFGISDFITPHPEETTAYVVYIMELMSKIACILGRKTDERRYAGCADRVRKGYRQLVRTRKHSLDTDRQAKLVRPLYMKLLDKEQTEFAQKRLIEGLNNYGWRLGTGFLSTPFILDVLTDIDPEYAYRLLENEEIPGWLSMPANGANTIWEAWEGPNSRSGGIGSLDHYSKGAVLEWVFRTMCGIRVDGENRFVVSPVPGGRISHASLCYDSIYGRVSSAWKKEDGHISYRITIPPNCTALLCIGGTSREVTSGEYFFLDTL